MIYADTSFLVSAYGLDANTATARKFIEANQPRLPLAFLHWPEMAKSFWTEPSRKCRETLGLGERRFGRGKKLYPLESGSGSGCQARGGIDHQLLSALEKLRSLDAPSCCSLP